MSRRRVSLPPIQQTFLGTDACYTICKSAPHEDPDNRPIKRRKLDLDTDGWSAILEFVLECRFEVKIPASPSTSKGDTRSPPVPSTLSFDDPVLSVSHPKTDQPLFAFVCRENDATIINAIIWFQRLAHKHPSVDECLRLSTSVSFQWSHGVIASALVSVGVLIRFDQNLLPVLKLSPKDRVAILDFVFEKTPSEVTADQFYTSIGRLPNDYGKGVTDNLLQHPLITCRLFPFQTRAVAWMLRQEGKVFDSASDTASIDVVPSSNNHTTHLPPSWEPLVDPDNRVLYINRHQGFASLNKNWV